MRFLFSLILFFVLSFAFSQIPNGYYSSANGTGYTLKTQLHDIIDDHNVRSYGSLWDFYEEHELDKYYENDGTILDVYSENPTGNDPYNYTKVTNQCGNYSGEGSCYNREHSFPRSWFNDASPMESDVMHIVATDGYVNGQRGSFPFGEVGTATYTSQNGSKKGLGRSGLGYSGTVFEPINEFKGDFARIYFYMATRYEDIIGNWSSPMLDGSSNKVYTTWALDMLMTWHTNDPVSQKEIDRNNAAYNYQGNRNPFVDHPEWVNAIWGDGQVSPTPTISTTASGGGYNFGSIVAGNSSNSVNYKVTGSNLEGNVTVSVSSPFQVSSNNSTWGSNLTITKANAEANTSNTVYVRFSPSVANGQTYSSLVSHSSSGASSRTVIVSGKEGQVTGGSGSIVLNTSSFNGDFGQTLIGSNSVAASYTVSASNLNENLTITAPDYFRVSQNSTSGFASSLTLNQSGGVVNATTVYVVFAPGVAGNSSGQIAHTSSGASETVAVLGFGVAPLSAGSSTADITIFPNPTDGYVEIRGVDWKKTTVRIFDSHGYRLPVRFKDGKIDVSDFPTGMYYFSFSGEGNPSVQKVLLK